MKKYYACVCALRGCSLQWLAHTWWNKDGAHSSTQSSHPHKDSKSNWLHAALSRQSHRSAAQREEQVVDDTNNTPHRPPEPHLALPLIKFSCQSLTHRGFQTKRKREIYMFYSIHWRYREFRNKINKLLLTFCIFLLHSMLLFHYNMQFLTFKHSLHKFQY